ncbi:MAG: hypothetical protein K6U89_04720 [Chloroflexi bacterium]|nr:hypothetical protein [Chloroflexota bacterium]
MTALRRTAWTRTWREVGLVVAWWPLGWALVVVAVELARARVDPGLLATLAVLGPLGTALLLALFRAGETLRWHPGADRATLLTTLMADLVVLLASLGLVWRTPWNAVPLLALAAVALVLALVNLTRGSAGPAARRRVALAVLASLLLAGGGGAAIVASALSALQQTGGHALSREPPPPAVR